MSILTAGGLPSAAGVSSAARAPKAIAAPRPATSASDAARLTCRVTLHGAAESTKDMGNFNRYTQANGATGNHRSARSPQDRFFERFHCHLGGAGEASPRHAR